MFPDEGAEVCVWFQLGNVDVPFFSPGHWGLTPKDGCEVPQAACGLAEKDKHKVKTYETARFQMIWDEREGSEQYKILDKVTGRFCHDGRS